MTRSKRQERAFGTARSRWVVRWWQIGCAEAGGAATLSSALHADLRFLAEPVGDLVQPDHSARDAAQNLPQCEANWWPRSISSCMPKMRRHDPSLGLPPPIPSSPKSSDYVSVFLGQNTSSIIGFFINFGFDVGP